MLSKKLTFSLTSLVVLLAFGLVFAVPSAMATGDDSQTHVDIDVTISASENMIDVDYRGGANDIQIATGRDRASRDYTASNTLLITLLVEFSHQVELQGPELVTGDQSDPNVDLRSYHYFGADDIYVRAFDKDKRSLGQISLDKVATTNDSIIGFQDARLPGRQFLVRVDEDKLVAAYRTALRTASNAGLEIASVFFFIPQGESGVSNANLAQTDIHNLHNATVASGIRRADFDHATAHLAPKAHQHINKASNVFRVDLVDDDQGDPQYATLTSYSTAQDVAAGGWSSNGAVVAPRGTGTPGVVSIMRTASRTSFIETGEFDVRIILTEEPRGGLTKDLIMVENGTVVSVTPGVTYKGGHSAYTIAEVTFDPDNNDQTNNNVTIPAVPVPVRDSELGPEMIDYYHAADDAAAAATPVAGTADVIPSTQNIPHDQTSGDGTVDNFPEATGRDNMYHSYIATIKPNPGAQGTLTVSIGQFDDNVIPLPRTYVPLTQQQRYAINLSGAAKHVRDARLKNETLTVRVSAAKDTTSKKALATAAYEVRQKDVLDKVGNEAVLEKERSVPAGGYFVLHFGDLDNSGIASVPVKKKERETARPGAALYITAKIGLPFPANDLSTFFRNGGTLNLGYDDIPEATGSGHDDATGPTGDDATNYVAADSTAYAAGALIFNEIMWGLDGASTDSQYIELKNTTGAAIGIDSKEWVISVGDLPPGYTLIDTVSNNPASGFWAVPGDSGVTKASAEYPTVSPLVSMSRIDDATDATAEASWIASKAVGSANLSGARIGTPGAANAYQEPPAAPTPTPPKPTPKAPVATASDLMISEVMVASNSGRLPQWIEIANVGVGEVSLTGWSISIDNDPADAKVIAPSVNLKLGDVTIGKDQVALVVSKTGRNSGVDTAGAARTKGDANAGSLDADRIIDVQADVSTVAQYMLISEMAFRISLIPPLPSGVVDRGDVVGNLGQGWELPMAETGRSSLIRREMGTTAEIMGTDAAGWVLASDTNLIGAIVETYYGDKDDMGTPGYDAGGALPVELSQFNAKRDPLSGQVIITWETQSELNNAGFFIKRSQQKNSKFVAVNPTMIPGAGTISEKQSYTYTDTTAKPNIVYYYQIEDVSLDGQRQTLTRAHRLKGHIGAAGKATTTWGELKTSLEQ